MLTSDATRVVLRGQPVPKEETHFLFGVLDSQEGRGADHRTVRHGRHQAHHPDVGRRTQRAGYDVSQWNPTASRWEVLP